MKTKNKLTTVAQAMMMALLLALTACSGEELTDNNKPETEEGRTVSMNIKLPEGKPAFSETGTQSAVTTAWEEGDELIMLVWMYAGPAMKLSAGVTLAYNGTDWTVTEGMQLIPAKTVALDGTVEVNIPEDITEEVTAEGTLVYAPECLWNEPGIIEAKNDAKTDAPETWMLDNNGEWTPNTARLRIYTGTEGDKVTLASLDLEDHFGINGGYFSATTDADGNAYFYGTLHEAVTGGFTVNVVAETKLEDGSTVSLDVPVLEASAQAPVALETGKGYKVDAKAKRDAAVAEMSRLLEAHPNGYKEAADGICEVYTYAGLLAWRNSGNALSASMKLMMDITLPTDGITVTDGQPSGSNWTPVGDGSNPYTGTFDGNGKKITGLRISSTSMYTGLVGALEGSVKDLTLNDAVIHSTADCTGSIAGYNNSGNVSGCIVNGSIMGADNTGGIVGQDEQGTVAGCTVSGNVTGSSFTGGIVGQCANGTVSACGNSADIAGKNNTGGIVGYLNNVTAIGCWSVNTQEKDKNNIGMSSDIDGIGDIGGISTIDRCYVFIYAFLIGDTDIADMNAALSEAGSAYQWQIGNGFNWPTLVSTAGTE